MTIPTILTPTLDRFAESGVRFRLAYSECPVCIPARRSLMTGTAPRTHGDRVFDWKMPMPAIPTLAQSFRDGGYQAYAAGKLHVYPERSRIGFDDVMLCEDGRTDFGTDDYETYLGEKGHAGEQFLHGMGTNEYLHRPWHLAEEHHPINWTTREICRYIKRRDPTRPGFYYLSYTHPHPPLAPLEWCLTRCAQTEPPAPYIGEWAREEDGLPHALKASRLRRPPTWTDQDEVLWAEASGQHDDPLHLRSRLLGLAGLPIPDSVDGISMVGKERRDTLYGEYAEDGGATRMATYISCSTLRKIRTR